MKITGNEPAYPVTNEDGYCTSIDFVTNKDAGAVGLTIRQQFAKDFYAARLNALCINKDDYLPSQVASLSIEDADALIAELNKQS